MTTTRLTLTSALAATCLVGATISAAAAAPTTYTYSVSDSTLAGPDSAVLAIDPTTRTAYAVETYQGQGTLTVIDQVTNTVTATVPADNGETGLAVNSATHAVYVPDLLGDSVRVIDGTTNTVRATVATPSPWGVAVDPVSHRAFVTNLETDTVTVLDGDTDSVEATVPVGELAFDLAVDPVQRAVYVANFDDGTVSVIDEDTMTVTATIPVGERPNGVAADPAAHKVYVTNSSSGTVSVIDTTTNTVTHTIDVGTSPDDVGVDSATSTAYVVNGGDDTVSVIDERTDTVTTTLAVGDPAASVYVDPAVHVAHVWFLGRRPNQEITQAPVAVRPDVTGVTPGSGPTSGGQQVVISGSGFATTRKVLFGQNPAQTWTIDSDDQITAVAPAHAAGTVQVRVKSRGLSARNADARYVFTSGPARAQNSVSRAAAGSAPHN